MPNRNKEGLYLDRDLRDLMLTYYIGGSSSATKFLLDGAVTTVTEDTVTPANNRPLPVKLTGVTGDITITADNLDVQLTHTGANPDSIQIGDGTDLLAITAAGEITEVNSTDMLTALQIMDDWDESDRCKVNLIAGQAGISAGSAAITTNTPSVTLATDDPAVSSLSNIDTNTSTPTVINTVTNTAIGNGAAEQIVVASTPCKKVIITAHHSNTGRITVGGSGVTDGYGIILYAGDSSHEIEIDDVNKIYVIASVNDEDATGTYTN